MSLKSILIAVDSGKACAARVDYALALADKHDAHAMGLHVQEVPEIPGYVMSQLTAEAVRVRDEALEEITQKAQGIFDDSVRRAGRFDRSEWRAEIGDPASITANLGRYADLIVAGQVDPDGDADQLVPEDLVLSSGRPVLIVPHSFDYRAVGDHIVVAWNGSREGARAVSDAMPLLEASQKVTVLVINQDQTVVDLPGSEIALHLARHGIEAEAVHVTSPTLEPADVLLNNVSDRGADLVVMGGYGTPRLREIVMGGMTRSILRHMTVPILMSH
ncbi:MAG: universal stress protein [Pseudomonadota bacterium]